MKPDPTAEAMRWILQAEEAVQMASEMVTSSRAYLE